MSEGSHDRCDVAVVTNIGEGSANFFVLQGGGEFDFAPID